MKTNATPCVPGTLSHTEAQLVSGPVLLELLFASPCRPTLRWLRDQQKSGRIPYYKIGQLVFFDPVAVRAAFEANRATKPTQP